MAIVNIKHRGLKDLYVNGSSAKIGARYVSNAIFILDYIANIKNLDDCEGVKNFHQLKGNRKTTYSMHVTGNYCITFKWDGDDITDVDFEDYH